MSLLPLMLLLFSPAAALPRLYNETSTCAGGTCDSSMKYERRVFSQPGYQWVMPASLSIQPRFREPDTRSGEGPTELQGTLTVTTAVVP